MAELKCPHCGQAFTVDETDYTKLVSQVRDSEFEKEITQREKAVKELARAHAERIAEQAKAAESELRSQLALEQQKFSSEVKLKEQEAYTRAKEESAADMEKLSSRVMELEVLQKQAQSEKDMAVKLARTEEADRLRALEREKDELAYRLEREKEELTHRLELEKAAAEKNAIAFENELAVKLQAKDEIIATRDREIDDIRHMRSELSVKMIGESLERYCENQFNTLRATGFQRAVFGKDNDASEGTKGDYIYRELDDDGNEIVSIMFEMKNESDDSTHRKRNEDHFKKLDQDRKRKNCEYAVLVSLLEKDNDFYNNGIVDVSFQSGFDKMYVIRPQFFIPLITLIRNAALRSSDYRRQLEEVRRQNVDVTNFEDTLEEFKGAFGRNCELASRKFQDAIKDIDATIKKLEKIKAELTSSDKNLRVANNKLDKLSVKRLTRKNPTMKAAFEEAAAAKAHGSISLEAFDDADDADDMDDEDVYETEYLS